MEDDNNENENPAARLVRKVATLLSCLLGIAFQVLVNVREERVWENYGGEGLCYRYVDDTSSWPWVAGTAIYCLSLAVPMVKGGVAVGWIFGASEEESGGGEGVVSSVLFGGFTGDIWFGCQ